MSALAAFDGMLSQTVPVLQRMRLAASQIDEVVQVLRAKLLVSTEAGHPPLIASYAGRGSLLGWVRTAARRTALSLRRNKDEQIGGDGDERDLKRLPIPADAELDYLRNRYQIEFKQAVESAIATLDAEQLRVLPCTSTTASASTASAPCSASTARPPRAGSAPPPTPCAARPAACSTRVSA